jgi:hypothetical protein
MDRREIVAKKAKFIYPAVANYYADPLPLERGEMQHVWDVEGKRYLDFFGGIVTLGVGHCNPRITGPQKAQIDKLGHTSTLYPHQTMVELAEKIARSLRGGWRRAFLPAPAPRPTRRPSTRRACTRETWRSLRCATPTPGGRSVARSLTGIAAWRKASYQVGIVHAMNPYCYRCPLGKTTRRARWPAPKTSRRSSSRPPRGRLRG